MALGGDGNLAQICTETQQIWEHRPGGNRSEHNFLSSYEQHLDDMMLGGGHYISGGKYSTDQSFHLERDTTRIICFFFFFLDYL